MNKIIILFMFFTTFTFAQLELRKNPYLKGEIVLNDGVIKKGFIKLEFSAFRIRFKEDEEQEKAEKIKQETVNKIVLISDSSTRREFYYKNTNRAKIKEFVELIYSKNFEVYIFSPDNLSLFYGGVDRSNVLDWLSYSRGDIQTFHSDSKKLAQGKSVDLSGTLSYSEIKENLAKIEDVKYLMSEVDSERLSYIDTNKILVEFAGQYFKDCPELISKIEEKELRKEDVIEIVDFYENCTKQ